MAKRGPKPTPKKVLRARGSWRGKGRAKPSRPASRLASVEPPKDIARWKEALAEWKRLAPLLSESGVMAEVDRDILARYCEMAALYRRAMKVVSKRGESVKVKSKKGNAYERDRPELVRAMKLSEHMVKLGARLGLSPGDRSTLKVPEPARPEAGGKARFFKRGKREGA